MMRDHEKIDINELNKKYGNHWSNGKPLDKERNFWNLTLVLVGLFCTQVSFTMTQNFVGRIGRVLMDDSDMGFYSQGCVYLSFSITSLLFGYQIAEAFNIRAAVIFAIGAIWRSLW